MSNLKLLSLITGEELLANIVDENFTEKTITVENPVRIVVMPSQTDPKTPNVGLAPWKPFSDSKTFVLHLNHIVLQSIPVTEFINQYNSLFGGLVVPSSKILVP